MHLNKKYDFDLYKVNFKLTSSYIKTEDKILFLREFVAPDFYMKWDNRTLKFILFKENEIANEEDKILSRLCHYINTGNVSLGQYKYLDKEKAEKKLIIQIKNINEKFNIYVKSNKKIINEIKEKLEKGLIDFKKLIENNAQKEVSNEIVFNKDIAEKSHKHLYNINKEWEISDYQLDFILKTEKSFAKINAFDVGLGKAQPLDSLVLTPNGYVKMGDLKVNDEIFAYDGEIVKITGIFPQGVKKIYKIHTNDNCEAYCCEDHLWFTQTKEELIESKEKNIINTNIKTLLSGSVKTLKEIKRTLEKQHVIPTVMPMNFKQEKLLEIHPYFVGVLFGQNFHSLTKTGMLHNLNEDVIKELKIIINKNRKIFNHYDLIHYDFLNKNVALFCEKRNGDVDIVEKSKKYLIKTLSQYHIDLTSDKNKQIPSKYLYASLNSRISLLQGLLDGNPNVNIDEKRKKINIATTSSLLAQQIKELILSLGGVAFITHNKDKYSISFNISSITNLFLFRRNDLKEKYAKFRKIRALRTIKDIEYVGEKECQCIMIDHPSHLYITNNYIVTHNTSTALIAVQNAQNKQLKKRTLFVVPQVALSNFYKEAILGDKKEKKSPVYLTDEDCYFVNFNNKKTTDEQLEEILLNQKYKKIFISYDDFYRFKLKKETISLYLDYLKENDESFYFASEINNKKYINFINKINSLSINSRGKSKKDIYFEDFDFDSIVIDEMHEYKNSKEIFTDINAKYLSIPPSSIKGIDAQVKCWFIRNKNKELNGIEDGIIGLTATPLTNSPIELYTLLSLTIGEKNVNNLIGLNSINEFLQSSCEIEAEEDYSVDGEEKVFNIFKGIKNLSILRKAMFEVIDFLSHDDIQNLQKDKLKNNHIPFKKNKIDYLNFSEYEKEKTEVYKKVYLFCKTLLYTKDKELKNELLSSREWQEEIYPILKNNHENIEIAGSAFNFISKMEKLILDNDLDDNGINFYIKTKDDELLKRALDEFNNKKIKERRTKIGRYAKEEYIKQVMDNEDGNEEEKLYYEVIIQAYHLPLITHEDSLLIKGKKELKKRYYETWFSSYFENKNNCDFNKNNISYEDIENNYKRVFLDSLNYSDHELFFNILLKYFPHEDIVLLSSPKLEQCLLNAKKENENPFGKDKYLNPIYYAKQLFFVDIIGNHFKLKWLIANYLNIPMNKIAVLTGQTNNTTEEALKLQNGFNDIENNKYQIMIINEKGERAINLQNGTQAIHHLTFGWTPDATHQRNGRACRKGNYTDHVNIYFYLINNTFDEYKKNLVDKKYNWIKELTNLQGNDFVPVIHGLNKRQYEKMVEKLGMNNNELQKYLIELEENERNKTTKYLIEKQKNLLSLMTTKNNLLLRNNKQQENNNFEEQQLDFISQLFYQYFLLENNLNEMRKSIFENNELIARVEKDIHFQKNKEDYLNEMKKNNHNEKITKLINQYTLYKNKTQKYKDYINDFIVINENIDLICEDRIKKGNFNNNVLLVENKKPIDILFSFIFKKVLVEEKKDKGIKEFLNENYIHYFYFSNKLKNIIQDNNIYLNDIYSYAKEEYIRLVENNKNNLELLPLSLLNYADKGELYKLNDHYVYNGCLILSNKENDEKIQAVSSYLKEKKENSLRKEELDYLLEYKKYENDLNKMSKVTFNFNKPKKEIIEEINYVLLIMQKIYQNLLIKRIQNEITEKETRLYLMEFVFNLIFEKYNFSLREIKQRNKKMEIVDVLGFFYLQDDIMLYNDQKNNLSISYQNEENNENEIVFYLEDEIKEKLNVIKTIMLLINLYRYCYRIGGVSKARMMQIKENLAKEDNYQLKEIIENEEIRKTLLQLKLSFVNDFLND